MQLSAVNAVNIVYLLAFIPIEDRTYDICLEHVCANGLSLQFVPEDLKTDEICNIAIEKNLESGQWVPKGSDAYNNYLMRKALL